MAFDIITILTVSGLVLYIINYLTGWMLHFKFIKITRTTHQVIYSLLIFNIILLLFFVNFISGKFLLYFLSLCFLLALPFGKKGGIYHGVISSLGLIVYIFTVLNYQYFRLVD